jgi:hypothetical protein
VDRLSTRALGRTLLARQHLLERTDGTPEAMVEHLVGMQAQEPRDPYLGLWSRVEGFEPAHLEAPLVERRLVRMVAMRGTIHLLTATDALGLRPLFQSLLDQEMARHSVHKAALAGLELTAVTAFARERLTEPHTIPQLRDALADAFPTLDAAALVLACRNTVPLVQVPPRGLWTKTGPVTYVTAAHWLAGARAATPRVDDVVLRYLRAFGPATAADIATWSRWTGLREVVERLQPQLRAFTGEDGRELLDVPDAPVVDGDTDAPVRFLPEYDNVLLSHKDRSRVIPADAGALYDRDRHGIGSVLVDGLVQATWWRESSRVVILHRGLARRALGAVEAEAERAVPILGRGAPDIVVEVRRLVT